MEIQHKNPPCFQCNAPESLEFINQDTPNKQSLYLCENCAGPHIWEALPLRLFLQLQLNNVDGKCLDTQEERLEVATYLASKLIAAGNHIEWS